MFGRKSEFHRLVSIGVVICSVFLWGCPTTPPAPPADEHPPVTEAQLVVNLQIDAERDDEDGIVEIAEELIRRNIAATVYTTADYANKNALLVHDLYVAGFEVALHGYYTGEQLASMTYEDQLDLLTRAVHAVEGCRPCGAYQPVVGFRPQYFSQNEDTYHVLDELGVAYNSGFKAGQIPIEGYETLATPFSIAGHNFMGVPFTVVEYNGQNVYLCDIASALTEELQLSADQWSEVLQKAVDQAIARNEPLVALFHGWYTGNRTEYDYWQPFIDFLDRLQGGAAFVSTQGLVDLYKPE